MCGVAAEGGHGHEWILDRDVLRIQPGVGGHHDLPLTLEPKVPDAAVVEQASLHDALGTGVVRVRPDERLDPRDVAVERQRVHGRARQLEAQYLVDAIVG